MDVGFLENLGVMVIKKGEVEDRDRVLEEGGGGFVGGKEGRDEGGED